MSRYFFFLKNLQEGSIQLSMGHGEHTKTKKINDDLANTLKATGYLLLYNLIEATMRNAIEIIFDQLKNKNISFDEVRDDLKKIIIKNFKDNQSTDTLLANIQAISVDIISAGFNKEKLFSGNIDAKKIKEIAEMYGFSYKTNAKKTKDGRDLITVKTNRNDLAHGFKSFEEVGKNATVDDLLKLQKRVICYLREILHNIESYLSHEAYLK
ncbi:hypothetical protein AM228_03585 [Planktothricoides sp. SR001]|nr:hypothetical protein AM228_03585 [Planktothricoides sp. SR001]